MLGQAMLYARGLPPPNHPCLADPYPPLNPEEASRSSQRLVDEVTVHCDILGRLLQAYSGEAMAHEDRVRSHLALMENSPFGAPDRRVRPRTGDSRLAVRRHRARLQGRAEVSMQPEEKESQKGEVAKKKLPRMGKQLPLHFRG